jgi:hypothetical protein
MTTNEQWDFTLKLDGLKVAAGSSNNRDDTTAMACHYLAQYLEEFNRDVYGNDKLEFKIWKK